MGMSEAATPRACARAGEGKAPDSLPGNADGRRSGDVECAPDRGRRSRRHVQGRIRPPSAPAKPGPIPEAGRQVSAGRADLSGPWAGWPRDGRGRLIPPQQLSPREVAIVDANHMAQCPPRATDEEARDIAEAKADARFDALLARLERGERV